jgi:alkylation response protein AidB-like acyl-CoA dehydrogenase
MQWERACLFALYVGAMEAVLERTVAFVKERKQFGRALGEHQAVSHQVAEMKLKLESSRLLLYRACAKLDSGKDPTLEVSLAKVAVSEAAVQVALTALQLHGAAGYVSETGIEALLRDAVPSRIFSGTNEMQKNLIARELGL